MRSSTIFEPNKSYPLPLQDAHLNGAKALLAQAEQYDLDSSDRIQLLQQAWTNHRSLLAAELLMSHHYCKRDNTENLTTLLFYRQELLNHLHDYGIAAHLTIAEFNVRLALAALFDQTLKQYIEPRTWFEHTLRLLVEANLSKQEEYTKRAYYGEQTADEHIASRGLKLGEISITSVSQATSLLQGLLYPNTPSCSNTLCTSSP